MSERDEPGVVALERVPVVAPGPVEGVPDVERARLEGLVPEEPQRDQEEDRKPGHARQEQQVGRQTSMAVEEAHGLYARQAPSTACHCSL